MNWITRGKVTLSSPYKIISNLRGHDAWIYSATRSGVLAREMTTLDKAKALCEKDAAEHKATVPA